MRRKNKRAISGTVAEYVTVLFFYLAMYAFLCYLQYTYGATEVPKTNDVPVMLLENIAVNLILFCGVGVILMAIFNRGQLLSLTVHEQSVMDSAIWVAVIVLILLVVDKGIHSIFVASGSVQIESPLITAMKSYFGTPWLILTVGVPVMFLGAGLPEEFMRCYVINNGIRLRNGFLSIFAIILTSVAFTAGHYYQGTEAMVTIGAVGLILGVVYYIRQSFWTMVFIHTVYNVVVLLIPLVATAKPPA